MALLVALFLESGFIIGAAAMYAANRHVEMRVKKNRWFKFSTYFLIVHFMALASCSGRTIFVVVVFFLTSIGAFEIFKATSSVRFLRSATPICAYGLYTVAAAGTLFFAAHVSSATALYVYLIVCVLDGFSQIIGQTIGKHRLSALISPNKTIEGAAGGALFAIVTAIVFRSFAAFDFVQALVCGVLLSCAAIFGDLLASRYKRLCGIKDFGALLPGQGGIIDRFNSFYAAAPVFFVYAFIVKSTF
jgi:phosphatidate cytidylyltransferase